MPDRQSLDDLLRVRLAAARSQKLFRSPQDYAGSDDSSLVSFVSNDYLGLARDTEWQATVGSLFAHSRASASASRLAGGQSPVQQQAEEALAACFGHERALLFSSGYQANQALVTALVTRGQPVFADRHVHASVQNALLVSRGDIHGFAHGDADHLERRLRMSQDRRQPLVLTESLFSMDGIIPDPGRCMELKQRYGFFLVVDEAHALGVLGEGGRGLYHGLAADVVVGTLGKGLGLFGAFVLCSDLVAQAMENFAAPLIYSTALPDGHARCCLELVRRLPLLEERRQRLAQNVRSFARALDAAGLAHTGDAHIVGIPATSVAQAQAVQKALSERGWLVFCARWPTVPANCPQLRISLTALHTREQLLGLARDLEAVLT